MSELLIVDDDVRLCLTLARGLREAGHSVTAVHSGTEALTHLRRGAPELIVLDLGLPDLDGHELLSEIRALPYRGPVLILSARADIDEKVRGLDTGADDYLVKPFAFAELLARLRTLLRRYAAAPARELAAGGAVLDLVRRQARIGDEPLVLTPLEFSLLAYLVEHLGEIVSREMLSRDVWSDMSRVTPLDNVIDVHTSHVRRKLRSGAAGLELESVRGVGVRYGRHHEKNIQFPVVSCPVRYRRPVLSAPTGGIDAPRER